MACLRQLVLDRIDGTFVDDLSNVETVAEDLGETADAEPDSEAITSLHWADFETLVDVIFARSGWHRASALGGSQKLVDIVLEQPTTNERAAVQVKSSASQKTLDRYIELIDEEGTFREQ